MLGQRDAVANIAVKDLDKARVFYEEKLELKKMKEQGKEVIVFASGSTKINVYRSQFAGTNKATAVTWSVGDEIESLVRELKKRGVVFEHYDIPGATPVGDVYVMGEMKVAWFKDPEGNILNLINQ
jgi:catechol 2,3-dioxygenase-like lactoylglutathione lyase family enzyme